MFIETKDTRYTLADFGEAIETLDIFTGDVCQVDLKEMSPFELEVYQFLIANN